MDCGYSMNYWLLKSEPSVFGIDDLERNTRKNGEELWDGVRNYQARNFLRLMKTGEPAFFYHSNCKVPGIYGMMEIVREQVVDPTQFEPENRYFDPKSKPEQPRWDTVTVAFTEKWPEVISLERLRECFPEQDYGKDFALVRRGNRLSVMPVRESIYQQILALR
ncbi:EVE domain-containing protein [Candidatus Haliotispira prima]|uniref:EVE domain-containing protein n=1 Tax=Candidatus Haliotispira prima TaxID=3034016 RepID=A0ABY8MH18_9SPIO|nr:EVE domain-containing protein [Candidatus Haliotispira prima]